MSVFHRVKDRDRNGKPLPHFYLGYPSSGGKMCHLSDRAKGRWPHWNTSHNPSAWNNTYHTRPRRASDRHNLMRIMHGADPDGLIWHRDSRPYIYSI